MEDKVKPANLGIPRVVVGSGRTEGSTEQVLELEQFLRNVQMMLLNFYSQGILFSEIDKYYNSTFPTEAEAIPNPEAYGYSTLEELLRANYKPYFIILSYKGKAKPDLIRARPLNPSSYFMLKKGRDIIRVVRRTAYDTQAQTSTAIQIPIQNVVETNSNGNMKSVLPTEKITINGYTSDSTIVSSNGDGKRIRTGIKLERKRTNETHDRPGGHVAESVGRKIQIMQRLSMDCPLREYSPEKSEEYPPDVFLKGRQLKPAIYNAGIRAMLMNTNTNDKEQMMDTCSSVPLLSAGEFTQLYSRRKRMRCIASVLEMKPEIDF